MTINAECLLGAAIGHERASENQDGVMWWTDIWPMPWMLFGPMVMIVFAIICMAMMFLMMRGGPMHRHSRQDALEILKERFARGEINQAEYEERRRLLQA